MRSTCDCCGYDPSGVRASLRRTLADCEDCGRTLCDECLKEIAIEKGMSEADAAAILEQQGAGGFLTRCGESEMWLCPECFEDEPAVS